MCVCVCVCGGCVCVCVCVSFVTPQRPERELESYQLVYGCSPYLTSRDLCVCVQVCAIAEGFGRHLGLAFQIVDDILDLTASSSILGKPALNDIKSGLATVPVGGLVFLLSGEMGGSPRTVLELRRGRHHLLVVCSDDGRCALTHRACPCLVLWPLPCRSCLPQSSTRSFGR